MALLNVYSFVRIPFFLENTFFPPTYSTKLQYKLSIKLFFCEALETVQFAEIKSECPKMIDFCGIYLFDWPS